MFLLARSGERSLPLGGGKTSGLYGVFILLPASCSRSIEETKNRKVFDPGRCRLYIL